MVNFVVVLKLIINQIFKQFSTLLWDHLLNLLSFSFFKGIINKLIIIDSQI